MGSLKFHMLILLALHLSAAWAGSSHYHRKESLDRANHAHSYLPETGPAREASEPQIVSTASTAANVQASSSGLSDQFLGPHNVARAEVGVPPLVWNETVAAYAQWWATQTNHSGNCRKLQHSKGRYGESIFWGSGKAWTPTEAVQAWVSEKQWYHYETNSCDAGKECGHYTQSVWKNSHRIGCARVTCSDGVIFMTCNYDPPGNYVGKRPY